MVVRRVGHRRAPGTRQGVAVTRTARNDALLVGSVWIAATIAAALALQLRIRRLRREGW